MSTSPGPPGAPPLARKRRLPGPRRDFAAMEERRMQAAELFEQGGTSQAEIARLVGVSHQTVSDWHDVWEQGGKDALRAAGRAGRLSRLSDVQLAAVEAALEKGPRANGFPTELWNLARVAEVIEKVTGLSYSQSQAWRILRDRLGWSHQRPARRALERDDEAIERWVKQRWPKVKKTPAGGER